ncbi:MAG: DUF1622 domain-containing protein [Longimicrobiales bacterium]
MDERFQAIADGAALGMEVVATTIVTAGALVAIWRLLQGTLRLGHVTIKRMEIWRGFAMSLLLGLEFMLAADIVRTAIAPTWQDIGQLAAIAAIRTVLSYFLERDLEQAPEQRAAA